MQCTWVNVLNMGAPSLQAIACYLDAVFPCLSLKKSVALPFGTQKFFVRVCVCVFVCTPHHVCMCTRTKGRCLGKFSRYGKPNNNLLLQFSICGLEYGKQYVFAVQLLNAEGDDVGPLSSVLGPILMVSPLPITLMYRLVILCQWDWCILLLSCNSFLFLLCFPQLRRTDCVCPVLEPLEECHSRYAMV